MDLNEEVYVLVGKLVVESHFATSQLHKQLKDAYTEINQLKEVLAQAQGTANDS